MLILRRGEGMYTHITHKSGDVLRIKVFRISEQAGDVCLGFDDDARNFDITRPERKTTRQEEATADEAHALAFDADGTIPSR